MLIIATCHASAGTQHPRVVKLIISVMWALRLRNGTTKPNSSLIF